jgi:hypothetical protein
MSSPPFFFSGPQFSSVVLYAFIVCLHIGAAVSVSFDPTVDVQVHRTEESVRFVLVEHLYSVGILFMVKDKHLFADQGDGSLVEFAVQGNGAVFSHCASCALAEVILEIFGGGSETMHLSGKTLKRALCGGGVFALVVEIIEPQIQGFIEIVQGLSSKP